MLAVDAIPKNIGTDNGFVTGNHLAKTETKIGDGLTIVLVVKPRVEKQERIVALWSPYPDESVEFYAAEVFAEQRPESNMTGGSLRRRVDSIIKDTGGEKSY